LPLATTSLCAPSTTVDGAPGVSGAFRSLGDTLVAKDVELEFHGTINLLRPLSPQAAPGSTKTSRTRLNGSARHSQSNPGTARISWPE
jgi:hypothetical protein